MMVARTDIIPWMPPIYVVMHSRRPPIIRRWWWGWGDDYRWIPTRATMSGGWNRNRNRCPGSRWVWHGDWGDHWAGYSNMSFVYFVGHWNRWPGPRAWSHSGCRHTNWTLKAPVGRRHADWSLMATAGRRLERRRRCRMFVFLFHFNRLIRLPLLHWSALRRSSLRRKIFRHNQRYSSEYQTGRNGNTNCKVA